MINTKKTTMVVSTMAVLVLAAFGATTAQAQSEVYGTIVGPNAGDLVVQLTAIATSETCYIDDNGDGNYDPGEPIYINVDLGTCAENVETNDIRLTANGDLPAGSLVRNSDDDAGDPLDDDTVATADFQFYDSDGNGFFNQEDTLYLDMGTNDRVDVGDVRITSFGSFAAASTVASGDQDINLNLNTGGQFVVADLAFWDVNGDTNLNADDLVYLDADDDGFAEVNDLRLVGGEIFGFGSVVQPEDSDATPRLTGLATNAGVCYIDSNGDTNYDPGEPIYMNADNAGCAENVETNDIRLSTTSADAAGSLVRTANADFGDPLSDISGGDFRHFDADGNGFFNDGDTLYYDVDGDGSVEVGDLRITSFGSFAPGTTVTAGDSDLNLGLAAEVFDEGEADYWDLNGDAAFNSDDIMLLNQDGDVYGEVNDVILTGGTFGTLVSASDNAATPELRNFGAANIEAGREVCFVDENGDADYDPGETLYYDMNEDDCDGTVEANDVRLTSSGSFGAGTIVKTTDNDFGDTVSGFAAAATFTFFDADGNGVFNTGDSLYYDIDGGNDVDVGDVRISPFGSFAAGSVVRAGDSDLNLNLDAGTDFTEDEVAFWDLDGDGSFNAGDILYLDQDDDELVEVNDVRLTSASIPTGTGGTGTGTGTGTTGTTSTTGATGTTGTTTTESPGTTTETTATTGTTQTTQATQTTTAATTPANTADEGEDEDAGAPGLGLIGVLAALGVALVLLRRRQ